MEDFEDTREIHLQEPTDRADRPEITELSQKGYLCLKEKKYEEALDFFP